MSAKLLPKKCTPSQSRPWIFEGAGFITAQSIIPKNLGFSPPLSCFLLSGKSPASSSSLSLALGFE